MSELYYSELTEADRIKHFFTKILVQIDGPNVGKHFNIIPWQEKFIDDFFGTKRLDTKRRRYKEAMIELPRKSGKSAYLAGIALYFLLFGERRGEIYVAASTREQAAHLFDYAVDMVETCPKLKKLVKVYGNHIYCPHNRAMFKTLSREASSAHGLNPSVAILDETHLQPDSELYDVLKSGQGARAEPILINITTAGNNLESFCYRLHTHAKKVADGTIKDDAFYPMIFALEPDEDWTLEANWRKANPSLGYTINIEWLQSEYAQAKEFRESEYKFRSLYLNQWLKSDNISWIKDTDWMKNAKPDFDLSTLDGQPCYVGIDLSSVSDLTAVSLCFPIDDKVIVLPFIFCPEDNIAIRAKKDKVPYEQWEKDGYLIATPGNVVDYQYIIQKLVQLQALYNIKKIALDRWNSTFLITKLQEEGFDVVTFGQGFASMTGPTRAFERMTLNCSLVHTGNPILRWSVGNVMLKIDASGNQKPDKENSTERIDPVIASIMALAMAGASETTGNYNISWTN